MIFDWTQRTIDGVAVEKMPQPRVIDRSTGQQLCDVATLDTKTGIVEQLVRAPVEQYPTTFLRDKNGHARRRKVVNVVVLWEGKP